MFRLNVMLLSALKNCMGAVGCLLLTTFFIFTSPVYIYRHVVIKLANCIRSDLGEICGGLSAFFARDYLGNTNPRTNVVVSMIFRGQLSAADVKQRVLQNWINVGKEDSIRKPIYEKLTQYPIKWMGFFFWKNMSTPFSVDAHVHTFSEKTVIFHDSQLEEAVEKLLNTRLPKYQSPWKLYVIENYVNPAIQLENSKCEQMSVLIFHGHHCLTDGVGLLRIFVQGLFGHYEVKNVRKAALPQKHFSWRNALCSLTYPFSAFIYLSYFLSQYFRPALFKIPDSKKSWHMVYVKSGPISVQTIKNIKNAFNVSYASVLLSAISAGVHKTINNLRSDVSWEDDIFKSMLFGYILPSRNDKRKSELENHMGCTIFHLPTTPFPSPVRRLRAVHKRFEKNKMSVVPLLSEIFCKLIGNHCNLVGGISNNKMIPIGLTNVAGAPGDIEFDHGVKWVYSESVTGCCEGDGGLAFLALSHGEYTGIQIVAERALMTKDQIRTLLSYVKDEINILHETAMRNYSELEA